MPLASLRAEFIPLRGAVGVARQTLQGEVKPKQSGAWRSALPEPLGDAAAPAPEGRVVLCTEDVRRGGRASDDGRRREARTSLREGAPVQRRSGQSGREMARSCCRAFARFAPAGDPERCASGSAAEPRAGLAARSARVRSIRPAAAQRSPVRYPSRCHISLQPQKRATRGPPFSVLPQTQKCALTMALKVFWSVLPTKLRLTKPPSSMPYLLLQ